MSFTQHAIISLKKKITLNYPKYNNVFSYGSFSLGTQERVRRSRGKRTVVFEPLKFYCTVYLLFNKKATLGNTHFYLFRKGASSRTVNVQQNVSPIFTYIK